MGRVASGALLGALAGLVLAWLGLFPGLVGPRRREVPLPYAVPRTPGGVSLRFAMVHDVLHERYPRHGEAYYRERNRRVRAALEAEPPGTAARDALLDDLGAGLDALGEPEEAVAVLRAKLADQEGRGLAGRDLYTSYANLGTFLVHGALREAIGGETAARIRLDEGLRLVERAIAVEPDAHFGREVWQAIAIRFLIAASRDPEILLRWDLVGNRLDERIEWGSELQRELRRSTSGGWAWFAASRPLEDLLAVRRPGSIRAVGGDPEWADRLRLADRSPKPFDEPTLGIVGMWRLGGGPDPHFALALGGILERVGQRHIAWTAYERAAGMADRVWPEPAIQERFVEICRARQSALEAGIDAGETRRRFEAELAHGRAWQEAYQEYEARRIEEGASIDDPDFHAAFEAERGSIATDPGDVDWIDVAVPSPQIYEAIPAVVFTAGLFAVLALRFRSI